MAVTPKRRVAVTGGGTAGHVLPAIEIMQQYRRQPGAEGFFIGCAAGLESRLVSARGERLEVIPGWPWARQGWLGKLRALVCLPAGVVSARRLLRRQGTEVVVGTGGYASFSAYLAAYSLRIPIVILEANAKPGLANRLAARLADLTCLAFESAAPNFRGPVRVTGLPIGGVEAVANAESAPWRFLVLGGSEGSPALNRDAPPVFADLHRRGVAFSVLHICGYGDRDGIAREYAAAGVQAEVESFVDNIPPVYRGATLAIASAGAGTLAELSAAGVPSLLVPLRGAANDHQSANAREYASRTGARVILTGEWNPAEIAARLQAIVSDPAELRRLRQGAGEWKNSAAAARIVEACELVVESRASGAALSAQSGGKDSRKHSEVTSNSLP